MDPSATVLTADDDRSRFAETVYRWRRQAAHIVADCERMLECLHAENRAAWRAAIGEALMASRHLLALASRSGGSLDAQSPAHLADFMARIQEPCGCIRDAVRRVLQFVPVTWEDEQVVRDARAIHDVMSTLTAFSSAGAVAQAYSRGVAPANRPAAAPLIDRARVLIVEDDVEVRQVLRRQLANLGHEVLEAANGHDGLVTACRERPDLVLTDIHMPGMDGLTLLRELKRAEATCHIPVLVISGQGDLSSVTQCIEEGAEDHLPKPYEAALLTARLRASLARKRLRDLELDYLRRVTVLTAAAEAVEHGRYDPKILATLASHSDGLGRLARVFDRMVSGLHSRERRLHHRLQQLRKEMTEAGARVAGAGEVPAESPLRSGEIFAGRYEILAQLGRGGMGMVYRARDRELGEEVAVKVMRRELVSADPTIVDRLKSEIRLARRISHRNVVRAHDLGEWNGTYFLTMEYVKGITLDQLIDRRGRLTVESTIAIGTQVAEALAVAHEQQIIHRDIKPANLIVDEEGVLKVMDFGIACLVERESKLTLAGFIVGTPQYMAPEQLMGHQADGRADLFALGVVLYECLAGRLPFIGGSQLTMLTRMSDQSYPRLSAIRPDIATSLDAIIEQLLRFEPRERVASASDLAHRLAEMEPGGEQHAWSPPEIELDLLTIE